MDKTEAIRLLGGSEIAAAREVGITRQAVSDWPPVLPRRIADRVQAALYRRMTVQQHGTPVSQGVPDSLGDTAQRQAA